MLEQGRGAFNGVVATRFIGLDLAWAEGNPSGIALSGLEGRRVFVLDTAYLESDREIVEWISDRAPGPALVAIDAPIIAPNPPGTAREADRLMTRRFGRFHAGVYPANRERCARPIRLRRRLEKRGFSPVPEIQPRKLVRRQIEFYPHSSLVALLGLPRILKYKKGTVASRRRGLRSLQDAIRRLGEFDPALGRSPQLESLLTEAPSNRKGKGLKQLEDLLDAAFLSYIAAYYWLWGLTRCTILGDLRRGYIVTVSLPDGPAG